MLNNQTNPLKIFLWFGLLVLVVYLIMVGQSILMPLVIAIFIWYLLNAFAGTIQKLNIFGWHPPRILSFVIAFIILLVLIGLLVELIAINVAQVASEIPTYQAKFEDILNKVLKHLGLSKIPSVIKTDDIMHFGTAIFSSIASEVTSIFGMILTVILYVAFLLFEQGSFNKKLSALISDPDQQLKTRKTLDRVATNIRSFIWLKTLASVLAGVASYVILKIVGVEFASFWAVLIFFLNYIPYIGAIIGTVFPTFLALIQFGSFIPFIIVGVTMTAVHFFIGSVLEPWMYGRSLRLSPLVILITLAFWGSIWGLIGMIFSVPIMVIIMIICSAFPKTRPIAIILSKNGEIESFND
ncbi:AI-2E family transporter [Desulfobacterota bacterium AH_259_B03_O07]|nr:AI-2E family transporter [Desulfobacterota bacterium AH_259_B03_O07]